MLLFCGLPMFFMELSLGQFSGQGPLKVFSRMAPAFKGLGYGMLVITFLVVVYYNMIIAWTIFYTFAGLSRTLPWQFCGSNSLTSRDCFTRLQEADCFNTSSTTTFWARECSPVSAVCLHFELSLGDEGMVGEVRDGAGRLACSNGSHNIQLQNVGWTIVIYASPVYCSAFVLTLFPPLLLSPLPPARSTTVSPPPRTTSRGRCWGCRATPPGRTWAALGGSCSSPWPWH